MFSFPGYIKMANSHNLPREVYDLWQKLAVSEGQADPVCCAPDWQLAWQSVFRPQGDFFYICDGDSLVSFVIDFSRPDKIFLIPLESAWLFANPLLGKNAFDLLTAFLDAMQKNFHPLPVVALISGIQPDTFWTAQFYCRFDPCYVFYRYEKICNRAASLENGLSGWLSRRSGNLRRNLKKSFRKAAAEGIVFERFVPANSGEVFGIYQRMLELEEKSWKGKEHCGMAESPSKEFYACLLKRFADRARITFAVRDGKTIGYIFGSVLGSYYRGQQFSFDQDFAYLSPGNLLQCETVAWLSEEGIGRYDMGSGTGPAMAYKKFWTELELPMESWIMEPRKV